MFWNYICLSLFVIGIRLSFNRFFFCKSSLTGSVSLGHRRTGVSNIWFSEQEWTRLTSLCPDWMWEQSPRHCCYLVIARLTTTWYKGKTVVTGEMIAMRYIQRYHSMSANTSLSHWSTPDQWFMGWFKHFKMYVIVFYIKKYMCLIHPIITV